MDVIRKAIQDIHFKVPKPILEKVFRPKVSNNWRDSVQQTQFNVDQFIYANVIQARVMQDCNLVGGAEVFVPLEKAAMERISDFETVYRIPKELTQNRAILTPLNITFTDPTMSAAYGMGMGAMLGNNAMMRAASAVIDSAGNIPLTSTAKVQLISENTVLVRDSTILPTNIFLRCIIENDQHMSHIQARSYKHFSKLIEYAVKAYIYNEYIIQLDAGELVAGQTLGIFKEIVSGYADMEELYTTQLDEVIGKVSFMNDHTSYERYIKLMIGGNR